MGNARQWFMDRHTGSHRQLNVNDFAEPMLFPEGFAAPSTALSVSCHWHEHACAYITLFHDGQKSSADFSIKRIFYSEQTRCHYLLLGPLARDAGDLEKPPLYIVRVAGPQQIIVLDAVEVAQLLPLADLDHNEHCDLHALSMVLGAVPTWDQLNQQT